MLVARNTITRRVRLIANKMPLFQGVLKAPIDSSMSALARNAIAPRPMLRSLGDKALPAENLTQLQKFERFLRDHKYSISFVTSVLGFSSGLGLMFVAFLKQHYGEHYLIKLAQDMGWREYDIKKVAYVGKPLQYRPRPHSGINNYVAMTRPKEEQQLLDALDQGHKLGGGRYIITGMRGSGKSALAASAIQKHIKHHPTSIIVHLDAKDKASLLRSIERVVHYYCQKNKRDPAKFDKPDLYHYFVDKLTSETSPWLMVIDLGSNDAITWPVTAIREIFGFKGFTPPAYGQVIYITENTTCDELPAEPFLTRINLRGLSKEETVTLLAAFSIYPNAKELDDFLRYTGGLPLAAHTAALYLTNNRDRSLGNYTEMVESALKNQKELEQIKVILRRLRKKIEEYPDPVISVVEASLESSSEAAKEAFYTILSLDGQHSLRELVEAFAQVTGKTEDQVRNELMQCGFLTEQNGGYEILPIVKDIVMAVLDLKLEPATKLKLEWQILALASQLFGQTTRQANPLSGAQQTHIAEKVMTLLRRKCGEDLNCAPTQFSAGQQLLVATLCQQLANFYLRTGENRQQIPVLLRHALRLSTEVGEAGLVNLARTTLTLGRINNLHGKIKEAATYFDAAEQLFEKIEPSANAQEIALLRADLDSNRAMLYGQQRRFDLSLRYRQTALARYRALGDIDKVRESHYWLGFFYKTILDIPNAVREYQHALRLAIKIYGTGHINIANIYNDRALVEIWNGRPEYALKLVNTAIEIAKRTTPAQPSKAGQFYRDKAQVLLHIPGREQEALETVQNGIKSQLQAFTNPNHPAVLRSKVVEADCILALRLNPPTQNGKIRIYYEKEALDIYQDVLKRYQAMYGDNHTEVADIHYRIAKYHHYWGLLSEAKESFERAKAIYETEENAPYYRHYGPYIDTLYWLSESEDDHDKAATLKMQVYRNAILPSQATLKQQAFDELRSLSQRGLIRPAQSAAVAEAGFATMFDRMLDIVMADGYAFDEDAVRVFRI